METERRTERRAAGPEDILRARLPSFRRKVQRAKDVLRRAAEIGQVGVSFSGGKDSTVVLHLARETLGPDVPAAFFDSGAELSSTRELVEHYGVTTIHPRLTYQEIARYTGKWGYADPVDLGCPFNYGMVMIDEPSETFVVRYRLRVVAMGLRMEESSGRAWNFRARGELYQRPNRTWYAQPIATWSVDDVWAYIASRGLRYNRAYDAMTALGIPRYEQRVDMLLSERGAEHGKVAQLKRIDPTLFNELAAEFPGLRVYA